MMALIGERTKNDGVIVEHIGWLLKELELDPDLPIVDCVGHLFRVVERVRQNMNDDEHSATLLAFDETMGTVRFYTHQYHSATTEHEKVVYARLLTIIELFLRSMAQNIEKLVDWRRINDWELAQLQRNLGITMERISRVTG